MKSPFNLNDDEEIQAPVTSLPELMGSLTPGTSQQSAPTILPPQPKVINQDGKQYAFTPGPSGSLTAKAPPAPALNLNAPPAQAKMLPGMPIGADELGNYISKQKQAMSLYGPEDQLAQQQATDDRRNSFGYKATEGLKGFSDALMQGVAGAGNPGNQQSFINQENHMAGEKMDALRNAQSGNMQRVQAGMSLDKMDPTSELSKETQKSYSPLFQKLGYNPSALTRMSAANIDNALSLMTQYGTAEQQAAIKQYELEIEKTRLQGTLAGQEVTQRQNEEDNRRQAASEVLSHTKNSRFLGIPIPGTADVSGPEADAARKVLMGQMQGSEGLDDEDQQALEWANANPKDPRAIKIKARLGQS